MNHRTLDQIFPPHYQYPPDNEDIMRKCRAYFTGFQREDDLTRWIEQFHCPHMREAYAEGMRAVIIEGATSDDPNYQIKPAARECVEAIIDRIIRDAHADQFAEERYHAEALLQSQSFATAEDTAYTEHLGETVAQLARDVAVLQQQMSEMQQHPQFAWPYYAADVSNADKVDFERSLRERCTAARKGKSHDVKVFMKLKAKENIIVRPQFLKSEHQILHEHFDYRPSYAAYSNA